MANSNSLESTHKIIQVAPLLGEQSLDNPRYLAFPRLVDNLFILCLQTINKIVRELASKDSKLVGLSLLTSIILLAG